MSNMFNETIAAIATGQAAGGIGVIRISGDRAFEIADRVFCAKDGAPLRESKGYIAHYGRVCCGEWKDEAVALVFRAPHSYTGEDVMEISCHGGLYNTRMALRACLEAGAVMAGRGEFTRRAFQNGKLSLTQAEAIMTMIEAQGRQAMLAAQTAHDGRLATMTAERVEALRDIAARIAAWCDFPDEDDVPEVETAGIVRDVEGERERLAEMVRAGRACSLCNGIDTVICGRPNVGKSTLMNLLAGCEKSIVTDIPGTTRDIVEQQVSVGDCILRLSDTAGLRDTSDIIETIGVERTYKRIDNAALVIAVFDGSERLEPDDLKLIEYLAGKPCVAVVNKSDLDTRLDVSVIEGSFEHCVFISAAAGDGVERLEQAIARATDISSLDPAEGVIVNERQLECARRALSCMEQAARDSGSVTLDAINLLIFEAIGHLLELTGENASDSVIDRVFEKFCIGK